MTIDKLFFEGQCKREHSQARLSSAECSLNSIFYQLIRVALGTQESLSRPPSRAEWAELYAMVKKQSLVGICFSAVQKLTNNPESRTQNLDEVQYLTWMGMAAKIQQRNEVVNRQCVELQTKLSAEGLDSAILKGQGVATAYPEHLRGLRQSGDIDIWVKGGYDKVNEFVQKTHPSKDLAYHRFHYDIFPDTEVEVHFRPTLMRNLFDNRKLQKWCDSFDASTFVKANGLDIVVPPTEFNVVFLLTHIYRHFLFEGVGLRQVMDYYFVLKSRNNNHDDDTAKAYDDDDLLRIISDLGMKRFAQALMYVLQSHFGLEEKNLLCEADPEEGAFLLEEIMQMGNFGHTDARYAGQGVHEHLVRHWKHIVWHYPSEVLWSPVWLVYHQVWKWNKKRKVERYNH